MNTCQCLSAMAAVHVDDLRRAWYLEHLKNKSLKGKLQKFKQILEGIQSQFSVQELGGFNLSESYYSEALSAVQETVSCRLKAYRALENVGRIVRERVKTALDRILCGKKVAMQEDIEGMQRLSRRLELFMFTGVLRKILDRKIAIGGKWIIDAIKIERHQLRIKAGVQMSRVLDRLWCKFQKVGMDKLKLDFNRYLFSRSLKGFDFEELSNEAYKMNPDIIHEFLRADERSGREHFPGRDCDDYQDVCVFKRVAVDLNRTNFGKLQSIKYITSNLQGLFFLLSKKVDFVIKDALNMLTRFSENVALIEEGSKTLELVLLSVTKRILRTTGFAVLKSAYDHQKFTYALRYNLLEHQPKRIPGPTLTLTKQHSTLRCILFLHQKRSDLLRISFQMLSAFRSSEILHQHLILSTKPPHKLHKAQNPSKHSLSPLKFLAIFSLSSILIPKNLVATIKSLNTWKSSEAKRRVIFPNQLQAFKRIIEEQLLLKISLAFRTWQHTIYSTHHSNKENACIKTLDFSFRQSAPTNRKAHPKALNILLKN